MCLAQGPQRSDAGEARTLLRSLPCNKCGGHDEETPHSHTADQPMALRGGV